MQNYIQEGKTLSVVCDSPATPTSGDPVRFGSRIGVAVTDEGGGGNVAGETTVQFRGVFDLSVKGVDDSGNSAVAKGDNLFWTDGDAFLSKKSSGYFAGTALAAVATGTTATINVAFQDSPGSGTLGTGTVGTTNLAAGAVTAAKLGTDAVETAKIKDLNVTQAKLATASLDGTVAKVAADANVIGGLPVVHRIDIAAGALADTDVTLTHKTRVLDAWLILRGAGVTSTTLQVKNGANAITNAMAASGSDKDLVRSASIDDAYHEIAAAGTLRVTSATGATQPAATVYVLGIRVA